MCVCICIYIEVYTHLSIDYMEEIVLSVVKNLFLNPHETYIRQGVRVCS